jgi:predicted glycoside hydrolase/deacetylase ChbG (UPF0249 family)
MTKSKYLIVNADDFGQSAGINRGIIEAHERGVVTSASLMVRWPAALDAAQYAREHPELDVGLHLDFGEWIYRHDEWEPLYEVISADDQIEVVSEINNQLGRFRSLTGREPTHIDSHQHVHLREPVRSIVTAITNDLAIPLRSCNSEVRYVGGFYGQTAEGLSLPDIISVNGLIKILRELPYGVSELGCHPGFADGLDTMYKSERAEEIRVLCDPRIKETIGATGIELCSFADLPARV